MISYLLSKISYDDMCTLISSDQMKQMSELVDSSVGASAKEILINAIEATYGTELLKEKRIRQLIFYTIDGSTLAVLTKKYTRKSYSKPYDNAIELSLLPWKSGSEFVNEVAAILGLPNEYLPQTASAVQTTEELIPYPRFFPLHDYQQELKIKIIQNLNKTTKRFLIQMPTGSGKTRTVLESVIEFSNEKNVFKNDRCILWLAHTEELCEQAFETINYLWLHLSNYSLKISRCWGYYNPTVDNIKGGFVIGTFQKFVSLQKNESFLLNFLKDNVQMVIVDEAHKSIAKSYAVLINFLIQRDDVSLIGITATPGRTSENEEENKNLASFFDKVLLSPTFDGNPILQLQKKGILSYLKRTAIFTQIDVTISSPELQQIEQVEDLAPSTIKKLAVNIQRNKIIIALVEQEILKGNPCLLFSCNTDHSKLLNASLNLKGITSFYLDANTNKIRRRQIIESFKRGDFDILINYGILSTGFDAPRIRSIIVSRPTSSVVLYSQIIGRGLRGPKMGGATVCNLFDIKDNFKNFGGVDEVYNFFEGYWSN